MTVGASGWGMGCQPGCRVRNSLSSYVLAARANARACQAGSSASRRGYSRRIMAVQEPLGRTMASYGSKMVMARWANRRASWRKPLLKKGCPQQVCAWGKSTAQPARRSRRAAATPTSGMIWSTRQVTQRATGVSLFMGVGGQGGLARRGRRGPGSGGGEAKSPQNQE